MSATNTLPFRQLVEELKYGAVTVEEAAARIDAEVELRVERQLRLRGIETAVPNAEEKLLRDLNSFGREPT